MSHCSHISHSSSSPPPQKRPKPKKPAVPNLLYATADLHFVATGIAPFPVAQGPSGSFYHSTLMTALEPSKATPHGSLTQSAAAWENLPFSLISFAFNFFCHLLIYITSCFAGFGAPDIPAKPWAAAAGRRRRGKDQLPQNSDVLIYNFPLPAKVVRTNQLNLKFTIMD